MTRARDIFGIRASIGDLTTDGNILVRISRYFRRGPAHRAGLRYCDKIVEVNGKSMIAILSRFGIF